MGVVVVAAGSGTRLGAGVPKAFVAIDGATILERALAGVRAAGLVEVVLVVPTDRVEQVRADVAELAGASIEVVAGGAERTDSVRAGLAALGSTVEIVLVHDAARCLTPTSVFDRVIRAVRAGAAGAVPGLAVVDTIKVVDDAGRIVDSPARASLRAVQTPQAFDRAVLDAAYVGAVSATDDAALVEACGHDVIVVEGDVRAMKITTPGDLEHARRLSAG